MGGSGAPGVIGSVDIAFARTTPAVRHVLERGDTMLSGRQPQKTGKPGVVLVGGPGQGETTLSQLVAQAYRAALLDVGHLPLPLGVAGHEGSTVVVGLNRLRLLRAAAGHHAAPTASMSKPRP